MKICVKNFKVKEVLGLKDKIDLNPIYQRGSVWSPKKRKLLIDSMLMGIDIPKVYFRKILDSVYDYEISDGQQRLRAIFDFLNDDFKLDKCTINGVDLIGKKYSEFDVVYKKIIDDYEITVSVIEEATVAEVRTLFSRLQMGEHLIPSELRNALGSNVSYAINLLANTNPFFSNCRIPDSRFKHQDYIAHVIALMHFGNKYDLKAALLLRLYQELTSTYPAEHFKNSDLILKIMNQINIKSGFKITTKWGFVDIFYFLYRNINNIGSIDLNLFASTFTAFEKRRLNNGSTPQLLLVSEDASLQNEALYNYIQAFRASGGIPKNITARQNAFDVFFAPCIKLKNS